MEKRLIKLRIAIVILLLFELMQGNHLQAQAYKKDKAHIRIQVMAGAQTSTFRYRDSDKSRDEELSWKNGSMAGIGIERCGKKSIIGLGLATRSAGAYSEFDNNPLEWNTRYTDISVSYSHRVIDLYERSSRFKSLKKSSLYLGTGVCYSLISQAYQQIGNERFNMLTEKTIATTDFVWVNSLMLKNEITENFHLSLSYRFGLGLENIENPAIGTNGANQNTKNIFHALTVGFSFDI